MGLVGKEYLGPSAYRLLPQVGVLRHERLPFGCIGLDQAFLGTLEGKSQAVQPVQTTALTQPDAKAFLHKLAYHLPVPVGQADACMGRRFLHRRFQLCLLSLAEGGGDPPDCSKIKAAGPTFPKAAAHRPMV